MSQVFSFDSQKVRTLVIDDQPWFVGRDIALLLGYVKTDKEIRRICKHVKLFKGTNLVPLQIPPRGLLVIPESDVWRMIINSTLPKAREVEEWIMAEVLPTIRKTGKYEVKPQQLALPAPLPTPADNEAEYLFLRLQELAREFRQIDGEIYGKVKDALIPSMRRLDARRTFVVQFLRTQESIGHAVNHAVNALEQNARAALTSTRA